MDSIRERVVTLASLRRPQSQSEAAESLPEAQTAEAQLKQAQYDQIMQRLQQATDDVGSDVMITVQDRAVSLAQSKIAEQATATKQLASGGQEAQFGTGLSGGDWFRWIWSLTDWVDRTDAHPILRPSVAQADTLTGDFTVAMTADWGTGLYGAPKIADAIRTMAASRKFDILMHLGDVYYSGTNAEVQQRFLDVWPTDAGTVSRALNGNHEMYSGGFGYFQLILPAFKQSASYFALQNEHWVVIGLDTAYVDHDIDTKQVAWLNVILTQGEVATKKRKVVLFSHQQPFSRLDTQGPKLQKALAHLLEARLITAWYWGHEHQCVLYDQHPTWGLHGRCLGHGGIPEARKTEVRNAPADAKYPGGAGCTWRRLTSTDHSPGCIALDGPNVDMKKASDQQKFVPHGFMTLEFKGEQLIERVFHTNRTEIFSNTIV
jgi:calcineurin-like phosphoesterase family protein